MEGCASSSDPPMPGEVWLIPAGRKYVSHARGDIVRYAEFDVDPKFLEDAVGVPEGEQKIRASAGVFDEFLHRSVQYLAQLVREADDVSQLARQSLAQTVCFHLLRAYGARNGRGIRNSARLRLSPQKVKMFEEYVSAHIGDRLTLERLSQIAGIRPNDLLRLFRNSFGTTPEQYVVAQRLCRARWLLSSTKKDITSIAMETGFASHSHLTTALKSHTGLTPHEFRTSRRNHG